MGWASFPRLRQPGAAVRRAPQIREILANLEFNMFKNVATADSINHLFRALS